MESRPKKLLDQVRDAIRVWHHARKDEVQAILTHLALEEHISASTHNQALRALLFLYRNVPGLQPDPVDRVRARPSQHVPTVLSRAEVQAVLHERSGIHLLPARLLYSIGMRLKECTRYEVQKAGIPEIVGCHTFLRCFATHSLEAGYDIRTVQELLGDKMSCAPMCSTAGRKPCPAHWMSKVVCSRSALIDEILDIILALLS